MTGKTPLAFDLALLVTLATLWGSSYTLIKVAVETVPPITLIAARTLIAACLLVALLRHRGITLPLDGATWRRFLVQAGLNSVLPFTLIAWAERTAVDAGAAAILNATTPLFAFVLSAVILRREAVTGLKLGGLVAGLVGCGLVVGAGALGGLGRDFLAQAAILLASACYAGAAVVGRGFRGLDATVPAAGSLICGAAILLPLSLVVDRPWTLQPTLAALAAVAALAIFSTALAFVIYFRLVRTLGTVGVTAQAYLRAPIGVGIGIVFLGETATSTLWLGLGLVVAGVMAMTLPAGRGVGAVSGARP